MYQIIWEDPVSRVLAFLEDKEGRVVVFNSEKEASDYADKEPLLSDFGRKRWWAVSPEELNRLRGTDQATQEVL
jgi:hypothetical protein